MIRVPILGAWRTGKQVHRTRTDRNVSRCTRTSLRSVSWPARSKPAKMSASRHGILPKATALRDHYDFIRTQAELEALCRWLSDVPRIAFDTEFVSEHTYRPVLCLVQVAAADRLAVIDTLPLEDLRPFWEVIAREGCETIVHAGREETLFCYDAIGRPPAAIFDVQLAAGLVGTEYPAGYGNLIQRVLGKTPQKGETRTDWRRRPLSKRQLQYALDDVRYLEPLYDHLRDQLNQRGRMEWLTAETDTWLTSVIDSRTLDRWRRVSGSSGLAPRSLAVVREVWRWRETEAQRRDLPPRKVLRDDLIVELAKRRTAEPKQLRAVRGMERGDVQRALPDIAKAVRLALDLPDSECPRQQRRDTNSHASMLVQFLASALSSICRQAEVATSLVGTAEDVRELISARLGERRSDRPPALTQGWRAEVVGNLLDDLIGGRTSIRIADPRSDHPLSFDAFPTEGE